MSSGQLILTAGESEPKEGINIKAEVDRGEIVLIATTQHEARCNREIAAWQEQVRQAQEAVADMTKEIEKATKESAAKKLKPQIDKSSEFYANWGLSFQHEIETSITELGMIKADVSLYSSKKKSYGDSFDYVNGFDFSREFTFAELELSDKRSELTKLQKVLKEKEESLRKWRSALAGLGTFERQARASLAAHALQADERGGQLVNALLNAANLQVSELPSLVGEIATPRALGLPDSRKAVVTAEVTEKPSKKDVDDTVKVKKRKPAKKSKW